MEQTPLPASTPKYKDFMVDIETSGLNPGRHAMIQLSCVAFDLNSQQVLTETYYDSYLCIPPWRSFSTETLHWWLSKNRNVYDHITSQQGDIVSALVGFAEFVKHHQKEGEAPNFWMRRPFDWMFVESYFQDFELENPFSYKHVIEMTSFMKGINLSDGMPNVDVQKLGDAHNAYWDCVNQVNLLFAAINQATGSEV